MGSIVHGIYWSTRIGLCQTIRRSRSDQPGLYCSMHSDALLHARQGVTHHPNCAHTRLNSHHSALLNLIAQANISLKESELGSILTYAECLELPVWVVVDKDTLNPLQVVCMLLHLSTQQADIDSLYSRYSGGTTIDQQRWMKFCLAEQVRLRRPCGFFHAALRRSAVKSQDPVVTGWHCTVDISRRKWHDLG